MKIIINIFINSTVNVKITTETGDNNINNYMSCWETIRR